MKCKWFSIFVVILGFALCSSPAPADDLTVAQWRHADAKTQAAILKLARQAFDTYTLSRDVIEPPAKLPKAFNARSGVFVSAMIHGAPRCCMGTLYPTESNIAREIIANAVAASGRDRRFPPIQPKDLTNLTLIVTIVGQPRAISEAESQNLDPVRQGLAIKSGDQYGVVLSGETNKISRMIHWAAIRAGAKDNRSLQYFELEDMRFLSQEKKRR